MIRFTSILLIILISVLPIVLINGKLESVVLISRHGTRAPNPVVSQLCPADEQNLVRYESMQISLAGLTGRGMKELYDLGTYTRQRYIESDHLIDKYFDNTEIYIRAVGEDRTLQSAVAFSQSLFPAGTSATGYYDSLPSPVPVYTLPDETDNLLEIRKAACAKQLKADVHQWDISKGIELYANNKELLLEIESMCGVKLEQAIIGSGDNYFDAIKDITDAFTFDLIEQFQPLSGLNIQKLLEYRTIAVKQLIGRILGTDQQITYLNGELPAAIEDNFKSIQQQKGEGLKLIAYHGHREMIYAVGKYYQLEFDIKFPGLPRGAIPPATSLFIELHSVDSNTNTNTTDYIVRIFIWTPCNDNEKQSGSITCPAKQLHPAACATPDCTWAEFHSITTERIKRTGTWEQLCSNTATTTTKLVDPIIISSISTVDTTNTDILIPQLANTAGNNSNSNINRFLLISLLISGVAGLVWLFIKQYKQTYYTVLP